MSTSSLKTTAVPFLGHRDGSQPLAWRAGRFVSAGEFLSDVKALVARLPERAFAVNLCRDRYCFAVAFAAVMMRGQTNLLPATQALESLRELQRQYEAAYLLVDDEQVRNAESVRVCVGTGREPYAPDKLAFAPDMIAAIAFTSGSTGDPLPNPKKWGAMAIGGTSEALRFGLVERDSSVIVGTVPPQHMYGLETTLIMPMRSGLIFHHDRPFFPADVRAALASVDADRVLVSTPVHLRALLTSDIDLPRLRMTISATAPLSEEMARQFESRFGVEVQEVYGFTEAGMVATRRTLDGPRWWLLPGLTMRKEDGRVLFSGGHVPAEEPSSDLIEMIDDKHFVLRGRGADLVNIAGKRTSLGYLGHQLCAINGVQDGAFFFPEDGGEKVSRLMAFAVAPGLKSEQLLEALSHRIDPVFLPRPLYVVEALPRSATGKLPQRELIELARRCALANHRQPVIVRRTIDPAHPALPGHFPGDPVVPGVVLLDEILDAVYREFAAPADAAVVTIRSAKFLRPVQPGEDLNIELRAGDEAVVNFICRVGNETAVKGSLLLNRPGQQ